MTAMHARRRRIGATIASALTLATYVVIGAALPAHADAACSGGTSGTALLIDFGDVGVAVSATVSFNVSNKVYVSIGNVSPVAQCNAAGESYDLAAGVSIRQGQGDLYVTVILAYSGASYHGTLDVDLGGGTDELNLIGSNGNDDLYLSGLTTANSESIVWQGLAGDDVLDAAQIGAQSFVGGEGIDTVTYTAKSCAVTADLDGEADDGCSGENDRVNTDVENLTGGSDADVLTGDANANILRGGGGTDTLTGGAGDDILIGEVGNDTLVGGLGADIFQGEQGIDTADYSTAASAIKIDLARGSARGAAAGDTFDTVENITGTPFGDTIAGDANANTIAGGDGGDSLKGNDGNDSLTGDAGTDVAVGGAGTDTCTAERTRTCEP